MVAPFFIEGSSLVVRFVVRSFIVSLVVVRSFMVSLVVVRSSFKGVVRNVLVMVRIHFLMMRCVVIISVMIKLVVSFMRMVNDSVVRVHFMMGVSLEILALADDIVGIWVRHMRPLNVDMFVVCVRVLLRLVVRVEVNRVVAVFANMVRSVLRIVVAFKFLAVESVRVNVNMVIVFVVCICVMSINVVSLLMMLIIVVRNSRRLLKLVVLLDARVLISHSLGSLNLLFLGRLALGVNLVMITDNLVVLAHTVQRLFMLSSNVLECFLGFGFGEVLIDRVCVLSSVVRFVVVGVVGVVPVVLGFD